MNVWETGATTHAVNDTVLTVVNDGNGEQCGADYRARQQAAQRRDVYAFRAMARAYSRWRHRHGSPHLTAVEVREAADLLLLYYTDEARDAEGGAKIPLTGNGDLT